MAFSWKGRNRTADASLFRAVISDSHLIDLSSRFHLLNPKIHSIILGGQVKTGQ